MSESQSAPSVRKLAREEPDPAAPAFVGKMQQAANLANENCDRAMALAHKLSAQLREAHDRINQLEREADGFANRLREEVEATVAEMQADADALVDRGKREADERTVRMEAEAQDRVVRLQAELAQAKSRADRAEKWLLQIRREIEEHLLPSITAKHDQLKSAAD
jgi:chemotaxis protein histidine kinase CheA